jgi:hypothetical protein
MIYSLNYANYVTKNLIITIIIYIIISLFHSIVRGRAVTRRGHIM